MCVFVCEVFILLAICFFFAKIKINCGNPRNIQNTCLHAYKTKQNKTKQNTETVKFLEMLTQAKKTKENKKKQKNAKINPKHPYKTGHSFGGGIATLVGYDLVKKGVISGDKTHIYKFGCMRVGNQQFAQSYNQLILNSFRI